MGRIEKAELVAAIEQAAEGIVITNAAGEIQYVNPAFCKMTFYSSEDVLGKNPRLLKSGHQPEETYQKLWATISSGQVWHNRLINQRKDGTQYTEEMTIAPVRAESGEIASYIAIKQDVSERQAGDEARRFLAAMVECCEDAIAAYDPAGTILTWNRAAETMFGYSAGDVVGRPVGMLVAEGRQPHLNRVTEQVLQGNAIAQHEGKVVRKDGRKLDVAVTAYPLRNASGEVTAVSMIARDISERKQAEQTKALLASIIESSQDAILVEQMDGTIVTWNRAAEELFGYTAQEMIGANASILPAPQRSGEVQAALAVIRTGRPLRLETAGQRKDGGVIDLSISLSPIRDAGGEIWGASAIIRDIRETQAGGRGAARERGAVSDHGGQLSRHHLGNRRRRGTAICQSALPGILRYLLSPGGGR